MQDFIGAKDVLSRERLRELELARFQVDEIDGVGIVSPDEDEELQRDEALLIPTTLDFQLISGLSNELRGKLETSRPANMLQASRIEGMTPAALLLLSSYLRSKTDMAHVGT